MDNERHIVRVLKAIVLTGLMLVTGCAATKTSRELMPTPIGLTLGVQHPGGDFQAACNGAVEEIPVFVVSGRNLVEKKEALDPFGSERSRHPSLGVAYVTIGEGLTAQELHHETVSNNKRKRARAEFKRIEITKQPIEIDPWKVKDNVIRHDGNPWVQAVRAQLDQSQNRTIYIYVHGYNTEFIDNTLLAAEFFHYLGRQGAIISFEWPSESRLLGYIADKGNATYSTRHFRAMLSNIAKECGVDSITIIAHSAGTPIVVGAMREIRLLEYDLTAQQVQQKYKLDRVVLAAPDMDLQEFINGVFDRFYEVANAVAVYASPKDRALSISAKLYGNQRLGGAVGNLEDWEKQVLGNVSQIQLIDASQAERIFGNFLGHSYFHRDPWISSDIGSFILDRTPENRGLVRSDDAIFWNFPIDFPDRLRERLSLPALRSVSDVLNHSR